MEENDIKEDQIESIIRDFAAYSLRHKLPYDIIIKSGYEALYLEHKFGIPIEQIPEYISKGKETIGRLEDQRQEILRKKLQAQQERDEIRQDRDEIVVQLEKYREEMPAIKRINELEVELDEAKKLNEYYERSNRSLEKELDHVRREAMVLEADKIEIDARWRDTADRLVRCLGRLDNKRQ